jgi:phosphotriesterase-related protein
VARIETLAGPLDASQLGTTLMVLSQDYAVFMDILPWEAVPQLLPRWSYLHIHRDVLPALRERGVTEEQIEQMLVANPRAIFEAQGGY